MIINVFISLLIITAVRELLDVRGLVKKEFLTPLVLSIGVVFSYILMGAKDYAGVVSVYVIVSSALLVKNSILVRLLQIVSVILGYTYNFQLGVLLFTFISGISLKGSSSTRIGQLLVLLVGFLAYFKSAVFFYYLLPPLLLLVSIESGENYIKRINSILLLVMLMVTEGHFIPSTEYVTFGFCLLASFGLVNYSQVERKKLTLLFIIGLVTMLANAQSLAVILLLAMMGELIESGLNFVYQQKKDIPYSMEQLRGLGPTSIYVPYVILLILNTQYIGLVLFFLLAFVAMSILHERQLYNFNSRETWLSLGIGLVLSLIVNGFKGSGYVLLGLGKEIDVVNSSSSVTFYVLWTLLLLLCVGINFLKTRYEDKFWTKIYRLSNGYFKPTITHLIVLIEGIFKEAGESRGTQAVKAIRLRDRIEFNYSDLIDVMGLFTLLATCVYLIIAMGVI